MNSFHFLSGSIHPSKMKPITFYSARHTYASALYHANVPMGLIAQNMGRNPAEIETYLKDFDRDSVIDANQYLLLPQRMLIRKVRKRSLSVGVLKDRTRNVMMLLKNRNVCRCRKSSYICDVKWCRKAIGNYG